MIVPCPPDLFAFRQRPVTWMLVGLNCALFFVFFVFSQRAAFPEILQRENLETGGRLFFQEILFLPAERAYQVPDWVLAGKRDSAFHLQQVGFYSIQQSDFLSHVSERKWQGDPVAIIRFQQAVEKFRDQGNSDSLKVFGLTASHPRLLSWITYQFSHLDIVHLFSNMVFLLLVGVVIEGISSGAFLLAVYMLGGLGGALLFVLLFPYGTTPMVGASGAVSALLAFYGVVLGRQRARFFYFVFPTRGLQGFIWLPALIVFPLFLISDLTALLAAPPGWTSGVAHSAHVGGALIGVGMGLVFRQWSTKRSHRRLTAALGS